MKRVLVTGSAGFIGRHLVRKLGESADTNLALIDKVAGADILTCDLPDDIDRVYHLAAQTDAQNEDAWADANTNIMGTLRLLKKYRHRLVFASSSMVTHPSVPYAISKAAGEAYCMLYEASVVRLCNIYGEGGHSVIDKFREAETLTIRGSGEQRRTYAHVDQAVRAFIRVPYNRTTILQGETMTVNEIAAKYHPMKPIQYEPASHLDPMEVVQ